MFRDLCMIQKKNTSPQTVIVTIVIINLTRHPTYSETASTLLFSVTIHFVLQLLLPSLNPPSELPDITLRTSIDPRSHPSRRNNSGKTDHPGPLEWLRPRIVHRPTVHVSLNMKMWTVPPYTGSLLTPSTSALGLFTQTWLLFDLNREFPFGRWDGQTENNSSPQPETTGTGFWEVLSGSWLFNPRKPSTTVQDLVFQT